MQKERLKPPRLDLPPGRQAERRRAEASAIGPHAVKASFPSFFALQKKLANSIQCEGQAYSNALLATRPCTLNARTGFYEYYRYKLASGDRPGWHLY
jgi:hypothetical protein